MIKPEIRGLQRETCTVVSNHTFKHFFSLIFLSLSDMFQMFENIQSFFLILLVFQKKFPPELFYFSLANYLLIFLTSPQMPTVSLMSFLQYDSCRIQLLTATLLFPGARSSSAISTQPKERTAKHWWAKRGETDHDSDTSDWTFKSFWLNFKSKLEIKLQVTHLRFGPKEEESKQYGGGNTRQRKPYNCSH